jgi:hypothetical protein
LTSPKVGYSFSERTEEIEKEKDNRFITTRLVLFWQKECWKIEFVRGGLIFQREGSLQFAMRQGFNGLFPRFLSFSVSWFLGVSWFLCWLVSWFLSV